LHRKLDAAKAARRLDVFVEMEMLGRREEVNLLGVILNETVKKP
jgi:hypothetical protein